MMTDTKLEARVNAVLQLLQERLDSLSKFGGYIFDTTNNPRTLEVRRRNEIALTTRIRQVLLDTKDNLEWKSALELPVEGGVYLISSPSITDVYYSDKPYHPHSKLSVYNPQLDKFGWAEKAIMLNTDRAYWKKIDIPLAVSEAVAREYGGTD